MTGCAGPINEKGLGDLCSSVLIGGLVGGGQRKPLRSWKSGSSLEEERRSQDSE